MFPHPVIAAVRRPEDVPLALASPVKTVFLMYGDLLSLGATVNRFSQAGQDVFVHIDLVKGLASDREAVEFLATQGRPTGVVSTKGHLIKEIHRFGLLAVHQIFLIDTQAFQTAVRSVAASGPDAVEIMPGLMPRVIREWKVEVDLPLVAAGLVRSEGEIQTLLDAGCEAVAIGDHLLWGSMLRRGRP